MSIADKLAQSIAKVEAFIGQESQRTADSRAQEITRVSGGAIAPTPEQLAALKSQAAAELEFRFAEQVASVANTFIVNDW